MARAKQLTIPAEDRPGTLARIAKLLEQSNINIVNIVPMNCATFGTHGGAISSWRMRRVVSRNLPENWLPKE